MKVEVENLENFVNERLTNIEKELQENIGSNLRTYGLLSAQVELLEIKCFLETAKWIEKWK